MEKFKEKIEEIIEKIKDDDDFAKKFMKEPVKTVEALLGVDLPDEQLKSIVAAIKARVNLDSIGKALDSDGDGKPDLGSLSKLGDIFKK